jgi:hypothetical protein
MKLRNRHMLDFFAAQGLGKGVGETKLKKPKQ